MPGSADNTEFHTVYICVGSNLGRRLENCRRGVAKLTCSETTRFVEQSNIYKTEPVDYKDQDWFINYAVKIETVLAPFALLDVIETIEHTAGRIRAGIRYGPRVLDLDIILYEDVVMNTPRLVIPHPRMHKRRFVLKTICDIDPQIKHPVFKRSMRSLLKNLDKKGQRITEYK
jgi:2-amino-4-hydroxy-6-hydroxymethyldihydropteridine diphosphokinase